MKTSKQTQSAQQMISYDTIMDDNEIRQQYYAWTQQQLEIFRQESKDEALIESMNLIM